MFLNFFIRECSINSYLLDLVGLGVVSPHLLEDGESLLEGGIRDLASDSVGDEVLEFDNGTQTSFDDRIVNISD